MSEVVPPVVSAVACAMVVLLVGVAAGWAGYEPWRGAAAALAAIGVVLLLVRRTTARFGGVTGDVYGAAVELSLATSLVLLAV